MTLDELRQFRSAEPFQPFDVVLVDGRVFHVPHPEFILIPPGRGTWVYIARPDGVVEHINTVVLSSVRASKQSKSKATKKKRGGGGTKKRAG